MNAQTYIINAAIVEITLPKPISIMAASQAEAELAAVEYLRAFGEVSSSSVYAESLEEACTRG